MNSFETIVVQAASSDSWTTSAFALGGVLLGAVLSHGGQRWQRRQDRLKELTRPNHQRGALKCDVGAASGDTLGAISFGSGERCRTTTSSAFPGMERENEGNHLEASTCLATGFSLTFKGSPVTGDP